MICILLPFVNVVRQVTERVKIIPHIVKSLCNLQQTRTIHLYIHYSGVLTIDLYNGNLNEWTAIWSENNVTHDF